MDNTKLKLDMLNYIKSAILSFKDKDIYVVSLFVHNYCDNPCEPTVTIGYNTECNYTNNIANASSEQESRWNYAFWLKNRNFIFSEDETKDNVVSWIKTNRLPYYPTIDYDYDIPEEVDDEQLKKITDEFVKVLIDIVKELHATNFIKDKFGKTIPVIIHELEYYDVIVNQNIDANSLEVVKDFVAWIKN